MHGSPNAGTAGGEPDGSTGTRRRQYLLFAGSGQPPRGGLSDLVATFTSEETARRTFREIRLRTSSPAGWAQLAELDGSDGIKPLAWFGIGAEPDRYRPRVRPDLQLSPPKEKAPVTRSRTFIAGLVICALLGLGDVLLAFDVSNDAPPVPVLIIGAVLGLITLYGVRRAWADARRGVTAIVVSRVLSALAGIPAFFVDDAPDWAPAVVAVGIVLTVVAVGLLFSRTRAPAPSVPIAS